MALIETKSITHQYSGREVLKNINLKIHRTEVFTLIGPTGSGKTTLLRVMDLLELPSAGQVLFDGIDVTASRTGQLEARRRMAYVQQRPVVFNLNVFDNVACGLRWRHVKSNIVKKSAENALEMVGMAACSYRNARTLSGGETQRVAIARALITGPEILFLDEPTANMDPVSTARIEEVLADIIREQKIAVVMTTHNMSQGQRMASRLGVLINGELLQTGSVNDIFNTPTSKEVAEFVGIENILKGEIIKADQGFTTIKVNGGFVNAVSGYGIGEKVYVLVRPETIAFSLSSEAGSARNVFRCTVNKINMLGPLVRLEVSAGFTLMAVITTQAAQDLDISIGKELYASFKATAVNVIRQP